MKPKIILLLIFASVIGCTPNADFCECMNAERNLKGKPECDWIVETLSESEITEQLVGCKSEKTDNPSSTTETNNLDKEFKNEESSVRQVERSIENSNQNSNHNSKTENQSQENEAFFE